MKSFWVDNPSEFNLLKIIPGKNASRSEIMNSATAISIYVSIIAAISFKSFLPLYLGTMVVGIIALIYYTAYSPHGEGFGSLSFKNLRPTDHGPPQKYAVPGGINPKQRRNVLLTDYGSPQKYDDQVRSVDTETNFQQDDFLKNLVQTPSDKIWNRESSQRQFIPQPINSIPNKQKEFAQWLYGTKYVCKYGSIWNGYNYKPLDSYACNGSNAASPTNQGFNN